MFSRRLLLIAGAGFAAAQSISSQCTSTLISLVSSSDAACLNPTALASLAFSSDSSIISTVDDWLSGLCAASQCTNEALQSVTTDVLNGCSPELQSFGFNTTDAQSFISNVESMYPTTRQVICLQDTSASALCVPDLLTDVQNATTTLSLSTVFNLVSQFASGESIDVPQGAICSDCIKGAYTLVAETLPSTAAIEQSKLQNECGTSFTDGQMPSSIQKTAV